MNSEKQTIRIIERSISYNFKNKKYLLEALIHKSYFHENKKSISSHNERLEFLGDSVLSLIIVENLYLLEEQYTESVLAKMKSYLVSESVLADIARSFTLGSYLFLGKGEESSGGRDKQSILANALEALIGAVYLDGGYDKARKVVISFFESKLADTIDSGNFYDYKTELQEKSQLLYGVLPEYKVVKKRGEEHRQVFTVAVFLDGRKRGVASGRRKKEAEIRAAQKALKKLST